MSVNVGDIWAYLGLDITQYQSSINKAGKEITSFEKMTTHISRKVEAAGKKMTAAVTLPLMAMAGAGVKQYADFNKALTESLAIMGDISETTRQQMGDLARELSTKSVFAAKDLAQAYYFLASAGFDAQDAMKALPVVTKFAQAGVFDLQFATSLLSDSVKAMGMETSTAQDAMESMTRAGDVLVKANTMANASVSQFAVSLTNKAATSLRLVNKEIEEGVAVLAAYANVGIKGERAGTFLAMSIRDLQRAALKAPEAFKQFGIEVFDASGAMRNMADIILDFENALNGMSDAGKRAALMEMKMQERSILATLALVGQSDRIREYEEQLKNAGGTLEEVSQKQLKAFTNQMKLAWHQIQNAGIALGEKLAPGILSVTKLVADATEQFAKLSSTSQWLIISVAAIVAVIGPLLLIAAKLIAGLPFFVTGLTMIVGALGIVTIKIVALGAAILALAPIAVAIWYNIGKSITQLIFDIRGIDRDVWKVNQSLVKLGEVTSGSKEWKKLTEEIINVGQKLELVTKTYNELKEAGKSTTSTELQRNNLILKALDKRIDRLTLIAKGYREAGLTEMWEKAMKQIEKMRKYEEDLTLEVAKREGVLRKILEHEKAINLEKDRAAKKKSISMEIEDILSSRSTDKYATRLRKIEKNFKVDMEKIQDLQATSKTYKGGSLFKEGYFKSKIDQLKAATEREKQLLEARRRAEIDAVLSSADAIERVRLLKQKAELMLIARGNDEKLRIEEAYRKKLDELEQKRFEKIRNLALAEETVKLVALKKRYDEMRKLAKNDKERQMVELGFAKERAKLEKSIISAEANRRQVIGRLTGLEVGTQQGFREFEGNTDEDLKLQNEIAASNRVQERLLNDIRNYGLKIKGLAKATL
jgi:TP901 family phage tail tape measure protein